MLHSRTDTEFGQKTVIVAACLECEGSRDRMSQGRDALDAYRLRRARSEEEGDAPLIRAQLLAELTCFCKGVKGRQRAILAVNDQRRGEGR